MKDFEGRVAVVTGGASGIGRGIARTFASAGMKLVVADIEGEAAERAAADIVAEGGEARSFAVDVAQRSSVQALCAASLDAFGAVHLVCNNAGVFTGGPMFELSDDDWGWVLSVNLMGVVHGSQVFAPLLVEQGEGHIVNTASVGGFLSEPSMTPYCASKAAVVAFSEALRAELAPKGVGVSTLCPGPIRTALGDSDRLRSASAPVSVARSALLSPMIEAGMDPDEVGEFALAGVRDDAEFIFTHAFFRDLFEARFERVLGAFDALGG